MGKSYLIGMLLLSFLISVCFGETYYVDDDGPADFNNIQAAINSSINGDLIFVKPGIYTGSGNYNINFHSKEITVQGIDPNDPNIISATIVDCQRQGRAFIFEGNEGANSVLNGITISNGEAKFEFGPMPYYKGGGIIITSNPTIKNCILLNNRADDPIPEFVGRGGGIYNTGNPNISNCIFKDNNADLGGGLYASYVKLHGCVFIDNNANRGGGACIGQSFILNCTFYGNTAVNEGGGLFISNGNPEITNCIFWQNSAGGEFSERDQIKVYADPYNEIEPVINYCCIQNYLGIYYHGIGIFKSNPQLEADYVHLQYNSPCINRGDPMFVYNGEIDFDGQRRIVFGRIDVGADEFYPEDPIIIGKSQDVFDFEYLPQGTSPTEYILEIFNEGNDVLYWSITSDCNWLLLDPNTGFSAGEHGNVLLTIDANFIQLGEQSCILRISDTNAVNTPQYVNVNLDVRLPFISLSSENFNFTSVRNASDPESQILQIQNDGYDVLHWEITENCDWLEVIPDRGQSMGDINEVTINIDTNGLDVDQYNCTLVISGPNAINSPQYVAVELDVRAPVIGFSKENYNFKCPFGGPNPEPQTLSIWNKDIGVLNWEIIEDCRWIEVQPPSGQSSGEIDEVLISIDSNGLTKSEYVYELYIQDSNSINSPQYVTVNLLVEKPVIGFAPSKLEFFEYTIGPHPQSKSISIWNADIGVLNWEITKNSDWLDVSPSSGSSTGEVDKAYISIDANGLQKGIYECNVTVSDSNASNSPQIIPTTLYVNVFKLIKPAGDEVWASGSIHNVKWDSNNLDVNTVDILFSIDGGDNWLYIDSNISNDDSFTWQLLSAVDSNLCIVRIVPTISDGNDLCIQSGLFTIKPYTPDFEVDSVWETLGKDYSRCGLSDFNGPELGCVKWVFDTNGPVTAGVAAGDAGQVYAACRDGNLYAIDANGNLLWRYDANTPLLSTPSISPDGTIYVGGEDGKLYAIEKGGDLRWSHSTGGWISASPAVSDDGKVFVASQDGTLYSLGPDGSELWEFETVGYGKKTTGSIIASPAIDANGVVYVAGLYDPNLYAFDANSGAVKWKVILRDFDPNEGSLQGGSVSPVVGLDGTIYMFFSGDPNLYAIEPNNGEVKWKLNLADSESEWFGPEFSRRVLNRPYPTSLYRYGKWYKSECFSEPVIGPDGTIYVSFEDPFFRAVDPNGNVKWVTRLGMVGGFTLAVGNNGLVYAACDDGTVYVVDGSGVEKSRFVTSNFNMLSFPVVQSEGSLVVSDSNDRVWAISVDDCEGQVLILHRPADLAGDGIVNFKDWAVFANSWLGFTNKYMGPSIEGLDGWYYMAGKKLFSLSRSYKGDEIYFDADLDRNLYVDGFDLLEFIDNWFAEDYPENKPPQIKITKPKDEDWFFRGFPPHEMLLIEAAVEDEDGQVIKVEFFFNEMQIGEDIDGSDGWQTIIPLWFYDMFYGPEWVCISAKATDDRGASALAVVQVCFYHWFLM